MSITDRPDPDIPFAPKPRHLRPVAPVPLTEAEEAKAFDGTGAFNDLPRRDPIQSDIVAQLREIAAAQGFTLVPTAEAIMASDPTDVHYVANSLNALRYLDLKQVAKDMLGDAKPGTPAEFADLMAEWAAANKTKGA